MEDELVERVVSLVRAAGGAAWREVARAVAEHPGRARLQWPAPAEPDYARLGAALRALACERVLSVGCGSGLLEWTLHHATGLAALGVEVDGGWWGCRHAPPGFVPRLLAAPGAAGPGPRVLAALAEPATALLFCYFNDRAAFERYVRLFAGSVLVIIGPHGKPVHAEPGPFEPPRGWALAHSWEIRRTGDYVAVYCKRE